MINSRENRSSKDSNRYNTKIFILLLLVLDYTKTLLEIILKEITLIY
jgi:hypothetical protein